MKQHTISGSPVQIALLQTWPEMVSCAIRVRGINDKIPEDMLKLFFENERRSGGGDIEDFFVDRPSGFAVITFESREGL
jgi:hypothetical protein